LIDIEEHEKRTGSQKEEKLKGKGEERKIKEVLFISFNYHRCSTMPTSTIIPDIQTPSTIQSVCFSSPYVFENGFV
jgi:hypothetical protein